MRYVVLVVLALGATVAALGLAAGLASLGFHGILVIACGALPVLLSALPGLAQITFPRWAGALCLVSFLVAAMKTRDADSLSNIMVAAFVGGLVSLALVIKPYRPAKR